MLANDEVNSYLLKIYKSISLGVGESYASGVMHAYHFLGNRVSWYDVRSRVSGIADKYFDTVVSSGKGYGDMDVSGKYAEIKAGLEDVKNSSPDKVWEYLSDVNSGFETLSNEQCLLAYRQGIINTYIENGIEYVQLKCSNDWCQGYGKHANKVYKIGTQPDLPMNVCSGDYRPYKPQPQEYWFAEQVEGFTKKESDIIDEADERINQIMLEAEKAVLRIMGMK